VCSCEGFAIYTPANQNETSHATVRIAVYKHNYVYRLQTRLFITYKLTADTTILGNKFPPGIRTEALLFPPERYNLPTRLHDDITQNNTL